MLHKASIRNYEIVHVYFNIITDDDVMLSYKRRRRTTGDEVALTDDEVTLTGDDVALIDDRRRSTH